MKTTCRVFALLLTLVLALCLMTACGEGSTSELSFENKLSTTIDNIYISDVNSDSWGDPVNLAKVNSGHSIQFDFSKFNGQPGTYDIGAIDENAMNYDIYEVPLAIGDQISVSGNSSSATYTMTHADGTSDQYDAYIYEN